jgi:hypothetical protein
MIVAATNWMRFTDETVRLSPAASPTARYFATYRLTEEPTPNCVRPK